MDWEFVFKKFVNEDSFFNDLKMIKGMNLTNIHNIAKFYNVSKNTIEKCVCRHKETLTQDGVKLYSRNELRSILHDDVFIKNISKGADKLIIEDESFIITNRGITLIPKETVLKIGLFLEQSDKANKLKEKLGLYKGRCGKIRKEIELFNLIKPTVEKLNLTLYQQYSVLNYKIDAYIPEINLAIEYDEKNHTCYSYESQEGRENIIQNEIGCDFLRIPETTSYAEGISLIIQRILELENIELHRKKIS